MITYLLFLTKESVRIANVIILIHNLLDGKKKNDTKSFLKFFVQLHHNLHLVKIACFVVIGQKLQNEREDMTLFVLELSVLSLLEQQFTNNAMVIGERKYLVDCRWFPQTSMQLMQCITLNVFKLKNWNRNKIHCNNAGEQS